MYKILDELISMNLAKKNTRGKKTIFFALTPRNLEDKIQKEKVRIEAAAQKIEKIVDDLDSAFNLNSGKPGVQYLEGYDGSDIMTEDMLQSKETIYTYIDPTMDMKDQQTIKESQHYSNEREKLGIKKKVIVFNTNNPDDWAKSYSSPLTKLKIMKTKIKKRVPVIIHLYSGKVVYINFPSNKKVSTLVIRDPGIYTIHRRLFEEKWNLLNDIS